MEEAKKDLKELEMEITCAICQEHYSQPKVLPCLHYYCKECILKLAHRTGRDNSFSCPECRMETTLPEDDVNNLETAFFINGFKALYNKQKIYLSRIAPVVTLDIDIMEVNKLSEVCLYITKFCDNQPTKSHVKIDCCLKSLHSGSRIKINVKKIGADQYCIQYTPDLRGQHKLSVSVNDQQVPGSPFPVFVSIPPIKLVKPVKIWGGVKKPNGITVNSVGEIIIAEYGGDIVVLDKERKRLRSIHHSEHQFQRLQGIAVDSEDNMYFTDLFTNQIFKSSKNCSKVQVHRVQQVKGPGHLDVAVVEDEVMVTEHGNEGRIMVYDRELKYVRQIVGADKNTFWSLSPDSLQNVYVSVPKISSVQVFSSDGEFLRSFSCVKNYVKRLKFPWNVCVAGQYVYVADRDVCKIVVFTSDGDYVTTFGDKSNYVCVDQNGWVYASCFSCNKIDIY